MIIYRFLNPKGEGLYQDNFWAEVGLAKYGEDIPFHQPPLYEDIKGWKWKDGDQYYCAFKNPNQIVSWFRDVSPLNVFIAGGRLVEIDVPDEHVLRGNYQCVYRKDHVRSTREMSLDEFIDLIEPAMERFVDLVMW